MGQISERRILVEQEISDVNVRIRMKERNVGYVKEHMGEREEKGRKGFGKKFLPYSNYYYQEGDIQHANYGDEPKYNNN